MRARATVRHEGDRLAWRSELAPAGRIRPVGFIDPVWDVRLRVRVDGEELVTRLGEGRGSPSLAGVALPVRPRLTRIAADRLRSYVTDGAHLAFALETASPWARLAGDAALRAARSPAGRLAWRRARGWARASGAG